MSDPIPTTPAGPSLADLQRQLQDVQNQNAQLAIDAAKSGFFAQHPHIPRELLDNFVGGPTDIKAYGEVLAERWPKPAEPPAPLTQAPQAAPPALVVPPAPAAPESTGTPAPSQIDVVAGQSADDAKAEQIRERMSQGLASRAEVQWLSQWGPKGFTHAMRRFVAETNARSGR